MTGRCVGGFLLKHAVPPPLAAMRNVGETGCRRQGCEEEGRGGRWRRAAAPRWNVDENCLDRLRQVLGVEAVEVEFARLLKVLKEQKGEAGREMRVARQRWK